MIQSSWKICMYIKMRYYCATNPPKLHDRKVQPFYYIHHFCHSEIHRAQQGWLFSAPGDLGLQLKRLEGWGLGSSGGSRTPMSGPWTGWTCRLRVLSTARGLSMWRGFLTVWRPLADTGLWLEINKSPFRLSLESHFCHSDSRERDLAPIFIAAIFGKILM